MKYLFNELKPKGKAHLWSDAFEIQGQGKVEADTYCRMWSTGGLKQTRPGWIQTVEPPANRDLCHMCEVNHFK
jgi:hypothetical protein